MGWRAQIADSNDGSVTISGTVYVMGKGKELGIKAYNQPVTY